MNPRDLMETTRRLAESGAAPPTQADLHRVVSTAYYAIDRFEQADVRHRRSFAVHVLFKRRQP